MHLNSLWSPPGPEADHQLFPNMVTDVAGGVLRAARNNVWGVGDAVSAQGAHITCNLYALPTTACGIQVVLSEGGPGPIDMHPASQGQECFPGALGLRRHGAALTDASTSL